MGPTLINVSQSHDRSLRACHDVQWINKPKSMVSVLPTIPYILNPNFGKKETSSNLERKIHGQNGEIINLFFPFRI